MKPLVMACLMSIPVIAFAGQPTVGGAISGMQQEISSDNGQIGKLTSRIDQLGQMEAAQQNDEQQLRQKSEQINQDDIQEANRVNQEIDGFNADCTGHEITVNSSEWNNCQYRKGTAQADLDRHNRNHNQRQQQVDQIDAQYKQDQAELQQESNEVVQDSQEKNNLQNNVEQLQTELQNLQNQEQSCLNARTDEAAKYCSNIPFDNPGNLPPCTTEKCREWDQQNGVPPPGSAGGGVHQLFT